MFLAETLSVSQEHLVFQECKLLARVPSSCITEGFFIRTAAFSFKSEWIPAVASVFMIKDSVSSHLLQNPTSCLKDKRIRERDANSERDRPPSFERKGRPERDPRGDAELAGGRGGDAEDGRS